FQQSIHDAWNGKLVMVDARRRLRERIKCSVNLYFVDNDSGNPHLRIGMLFNPVPAGVPTSAIGDIRENFYRSNCYRTGARSSTDIDMFLMWEAPGCFRTNWARDTRDQGRVRIPQNYAAHEFGHYLGRRHSCQTTTITYGGSWEYCAGHSLHEQEALMARGNRVEPSYAE